MWITAVNLDKWGGGVVHLGYKEGEPHEKRVKFVYSHSVLRKQVQLLQFFKFCVGRRCKAKVC